MEMFGRGGVGTGGTFRVCDDTVQKNLFAAEMSRAMCKLVVPVKGQGHKKRVNPWRRGSVPGDEKITGKLTMYRARSGESV